MTALDSVQKILNDSTDEDWGGETIAESLASVSTESSIVSKDISPKIISKAVPKTIDQFFNDDE